VNRFNIIYQQFIAM